jgi:hypothetical protein
MADLTLTLGGVDFQDFEIPDEIAAGGGQLLQVHKYAGGKRTVDAFGPDDEPLSWSGIFFDVSAEPRCQQLDAMRKAGAPVALTWSSFSYQVVIRAFKFKFQRFYQISYELELEVVQDLTQPSTADGDDPETDIQEDLDDTADDASNIGDSGLSALVGNLSLSAGSVSSIVGAPSSFLTSFSGQINDTLDYTDGLASDADGALSGLPAIISGMDAGMIATILNSAASNGSLMANSFALQNTLGRMLKNVNAITG